MYFSGIQIPDELMRALRANEVVFFCGAGVSFPPPSNLPKFEGLAKQIAGVETLRTGEKEDAFLGRLSRDKKNVHESAARILLNEDSAPTDLHYDLLRLFRKPENVRVVTTNFDSHFSTANKKVFRKSKAAEHVAPALPLGDDFSGIVYLHGKAAHSHRNLVLTDEDFGEAYITRGWVRRFLIPLFQSYVVVFVGYSHNDVTMTYLARGLTSFSPRKRFAFLIDGEQTDDCQRCRSLGVDVVRYRTTPHDSANTHQALSDGIRELGKFLGLSLTSQIKQMRSRARRLPPEGREEDALLKYWLHTPSLAIEFCRTAKRLEWCEWLRERGYFDCLFEAGSSGRTQQVSPDVERHFIQFAAKFIRTRFPAWLLELLSQSKRPLSAPFVTELLSALSLNRERSAKPDKYFGAWVNLLLQQPRECISGDLGTRLLLRCQMPTHKPLVLAILERLTRPKIVFEGCKLTRLLRETDKSAGLRLPKTDLRAQLDWMNPEWRSLDEGLADFLPAALEHMPAELCEFAVRGITLAHAWVPAVSVESTRLERQDFGRSSIAEHEQDRYGRTGVLHVLINIARDAIVQLLRCDPEFAASQVNQWWRSEVPLLHRLALFAHACDNRASADDLVRMVIDRRLLFALETKKETFDLLKSAYPRATAACRMELIAAIEGRPRRKQKIDTSASPYERYNLLVWLKMHVPGCRFVLDAFSRITTDHPDFLPREFPDLNFWVAPATFVESSEGVNFDNILSAPPDLFLQELLQAPACGIGRDRHDMCCNLAELARTDPAWGHRFLECAARSVMVDSTLWSAILIQYSSLLKTAEDWSRFRPIVELLLQNKQSLEGLVWLVNRALWRHVEKVPAEMIDLCMQSVDLAWRQRTKGRQRERCFFRDWYTTAMNQLGGWIGHSWFQYCMYLRRNKDFQGTGVPNEIRAKLVEAITSEDETAVNARIAITPWIPKIFLLDPEFSRQYLFPLFDWNRNSDVSQQTWSVLLFYSRGSSRAMDSELLPLYRSFAAQFQSAAREAGEHLHQFDQEAQSRFGRYIARIAIDVIKAPKRVVFLEDFISVLTPPARVGVAEAIAVGIKAMTSEERQVAWQEWLREYFDLRLLGRPTSLTSDETRFFAEVGLTLERSFPDFVERFLRMPLANIPLFMIVEELHGTAVWQDHPAATCLFLTHVLRCGDRSFNPLTITEIHASLKQAVGRSDEFHGFEDELHRQGWRP
ncbi:MAG: SIR2 family protein [Planctomycetaceae bacterium]